MIKKKISFGKIALDQISLTETNYMIAESAEQDQTAPMCRPILLYTFLKKRFMVANDRTIVKK